MFVAPLKPHQNFETVRDKKSSLQFLPEQMIDISKQKSFEYKGKKLKSAYLIDIIHNLILRYYFRKENRFNLSATILKEKYGYLYNYYINYLKDNKLIIMVQDYKKGRNARIYSLHESILYNTISRYQNEDSVLIKKYIDKVSFYENDSNNLILPHIKQKLVSDLYSVQIQFDRAIFYLDSVQKNDIDIYNRNRYSVESINSKHIFYHFDSFGRLHTNFTILKGFIRKNCLLIDGEETAEIDICNSQPLFLTKLIKDSGTHWVHKDEYELFKSLTLGGIYYQYLIDQLGLEDKSEAKQMTYKVFFGRNQKNSNADRQFESIFPTIHNFIKLYKKEFEDYKVLAYDLQKSESNLIFNQIINTLMMVHPEIKLITVHDSLIVPRSQKEIVETIFNQKLAEEFKI